MAYHQCHAVESNGTPYGTELRRTELAATLAAAPLAGGARALGIHYFSKHGTHWSCWAVWLRDDVAGALDAGPGQPVAPPADNAALAAVLDIYNLTAG